MLARATDLVGALAQAVVVIGGGRRPAGAAAAR
jgi:hypothetical protein